MLVLTNPYGSRVRVNPIYLRSYEAHVDDFSDAPLQTKLDLGESAPALIVNETPDQIDALLRTMGGGLWFIDPDGEPRRFMSQGIKTSSGGKQKPRSHAGGGRPKDG